MYLIIQLFSLSHVCVHACLYIIIPTVTVYGEVLRDLYFMKGKADYQVEYIVSLSHYFSRIKLSRSGSLYIQ